MYDVDDVLAGPSHLVEQGLVDGDRLCIDGSSANGYTTLSALTIAGSIFKAGKFRGPETYIFFGGLSRPAYYKSLCELLPTFHS